MVIEIEIALGVVGDIQVEVVVPVPFADDGGALVPEPERHKSMADATCALLAAERAKEEAEWAKVTDPVVKCGCGKPFAKRLGFFGHKGGASADSKCKTVKEVWLTSAVASAAADEG